MNALKITLAQLNPIVGDLEYNKTKILDAWSNVPKETDLIIFSELIICGYPPEDLILKPFFIQEIKCTIDEILKESKNFSAASLISCPWEINGKIYSAVHLIKNGEIKATTLKHHLPNYGVFDEFRVFTSGSLPIPINFNGYKLGVMICEDMWYKDTAQHLKDNGADILIVINGSPFNSKQNDERLKCATRRVQETTLPLIYINQAGAQDELVFDGASFILKENGELAFQGHEFDEGIYHTSFNKKTNWHIEHDKTIKQLSYSEAMYMALVIGLRDYVIKNNFPGILIGLSGGIDSALSAVIAVDALGADKVHCVMMPSRYTSQDSLDDAKELVNNLGVKLDTISIEEPIETFNKILKPHLSTDAPSTTFENIQPRTRGLILMALSNANGNMVLSTGNKSEMAVGYATLYGDMCGGFNALKDVYKTQVYELSNWRNKKNHVIPKRIITKAPTAELKENQTDQDTLPEYEKLDDILSCLIEHDMGIEDIKKRGHSRKTITRIWTMLDKAEYKRRQAPPGIKITSRAFGRDRRYPITNHFMNIIEKSK